ncbi:MAG: outer membrane beta-barrel protein [Ginsengibacter sp.]
MNKYLSLLLLIVFYEQGDAQVDTLGSLKVNIVNKLPAPVFNATVILLTKDSQVVKIQLTDSSGAVLFSGIAAGSYQFKASHVGYNNFHSAMPVSINSGEASVVAVRMDSMPRYLEEVTITSRKPFIELQANKTVINMESAITNIGTSVLEALEKLPGVTIDHGGGIALKGKPGVLILIDGKQTYLGGSALSSYLGGLTSDQVSEIEIMEHPSSKYESEGNAGVINIKTKKSAKQGLAGTLTGTYAQGRFPKANNGLVFNFHKGPANFFINYNLSDFGTYLNLYAYRKYLQADNITVESVLEQDFYMFTKGYTHTIRTGIDYALNATTSVGIALSAMFLEHTTHGNSVATWKHDQGNIDSSSSTTLDYFTSLKNKGISVNFHKTFSKTTEWNVDADILGYKNGGTSAFENFNPGNGSTQTYLGNMPGSLHIISAKSDFSKKINDSLGYETGWKSSHITTGNLAAYTYNDGSGFKDDLEKSNHFLYTESNHAIYFIGKMKNNKWSVDGGLRYEFTKYNGHQLGNALIKDTVFTKSYSSLFPNLMLTYKFDSLNEFSLNVDRRIDRPPYQKLNPFVFIINKYTYQIGNPAFLPQFTWSATLTHNYKGMLVSTISLSKISGYFSQLFYSNPGGLVIYTEGNVGSAVDAGASVSLQLNPVKWWNVTTEISVDNKTIKGKVVNTIHANILQAAANINNQFHFGKWSAELSGYYNSKSQADIQEILDPAGQVAVAISKPFLKNKLTVKLGARDIFHTQVMKGLTQLQRSNEYFREIRDSRVVTISVSYRIGKTFESTRHAQGASEEEIRRAENGS